MTHNIVQPNVHALQFPHVLLCFNETAYAAPLSAQYYYSVRIFPGQEPSSVWVGWVTSDFHQYDPGFELHNVRTVTVTLGDEKGKVHERLVQQYVAEVASPVFKETQRAVFFISLCHHSMKLVCVFRKCEAE